MSEARPSVVILAGPNGAGKSTTAPLLLQGALGGHIIDEAVRKAAREAILQHRREGLPVAIYLDGKVVWVDPNELRLE